MKICDSIGSRQEPFYSLEFFPPKDQAGWPSFLDAVRKLESVKPLYASVTYGAGGGTQANTLEITEQLCDCGLTVMPHLTCVGAAAPKIADFMHRLGKLGVHNVMALRGDAPRDSVIDWDTAEFRYASDLVHFVRREFPEFCIGVAGYPGAHPEARTFAQDLAHTKAKLDAGGDFVVTQVFFDVREYLDMVERLRAMGVTKPVVPGILPIQSLESIRRILSLCGANIPGNLYLQLEEANARGGSEAVRDAGIRFAVAQIRRLLDAGAPGIHLYTLNKAEMCLRIVEEAAVSEAA